MSFNVSHQHGEVTLWEGRPGQGLRYGAVLTIYAIVGVILLGVSVPTLALLPQMMGAGVIFPLLFFLPLNVFFALHGVFLLCVMPYLDMRVRAQTTYKLTDQRAIIIDSSIISSVFIRDLSQDWSVKHFARAGSVIFFGHRIDGNAQKQLPIDSDKRFSMISSYFLWYSQILNASGFRFIAESSAITDMVKGALEADDWPMYR